MLGHRLSCFVHSLNVLPLIGRKWKCLSLQSRAIIPVGIIIKSRGTLGLGGEKAGESFVWLNLHGTSGVQLGTLLVLSSALLLSPHHNPVRSLPDNFNT